jgi:hypothetical protein
MPIISSFNGLAARGFGFTNGLPPLPPSSISFTPSALNAVVTFATTDTSYPVDFVQRKIMQGVTLISDWATITSGSNISASNLTPAVLYTVYFRTRDTGGQFSEEVSATFTTSSETPPGAPTFSLAVAASDAGTFKFNITSTGGTIGTYSRTTQYRVETAAGAQLTDWTTISSNSSTVTAYGADTYNGSGALTPATEYRVRLRSVAGTSGTITNAAYQNVTTNAIVAPNAPTSLTATRADGNAGEFSFTFSHTQGTPRSYPVSGSQYRIRTTNSGTIYYLAGYDTYQQFSGTVTIGTSSYLSAILSPGSTYYIDTRTYDTLGTFSTVTSTSVTLKTKRDPTVGSVTVAAPAYNGTNTTTLDVTPSSFTTGSWPITRYEYNFDNGDSYTTLSNNSVGGRTANTAYTVYVRAVDTQGNASAKANGTATTNSGIPTAPSFTWNGMSSTSTGTASALVSQPSFAETAYVEVSSNNFASYTTYNNVSHPSIVAYDGVNSRWAFSLGGQAYNSTIKYRAYVRNKHGATGESGYSSVRTWVTPKKDEPWNSGYDNPDATFFTTTASCASEFQLTFGDVPATDDIVGYIKVTSASVDGIQSTEYGTLTNANTSWLAWYIPNGGYAFNLTTTGFSPNWTAGTWTTRTISGLSIGGNSLDNQTWQIASSLGSRQGDCSVLFTLSSGSPQTWNVHKMKNFILRGVNTTGGDAT